MEHLGQHGGRELAGQVHQGAPAPGTGGDAQLGQASAQVAGVEGPAGVQAGEEPRVQCLRTVHRAGRRDG